MATAGDTVKGALRLLGVLTRGETMAAEDGSEGLFALNELMHSWYASDLLVPFLTREQFTLTQGKASYTIGTGADIATTRPMSIATLVLRDGSLDYSLQELSQRWWSQIVVKDYNYRPEQFYYEETYPDGTLYLDSSPDKAYTVYMTSYKPHSDIANLADNLNLPPMYERALRFNLAVDLAAEYGMESPKTIAVKADEAKNRIKQRHMGNRPVELQVDYSLVGGGTNKYDIRSDQ